MQRFFGTWKTSNSHQVHSLPFFVFVFCPSILGLYPIEVTWPAWKMIFLLTMVDFQQDYEPTSHGDPEKIRKGFSKWWYVATLFTQCGQISCDCWCSNSPSCQTACHFFLHSFFFMMYCHKTHTHIYICICIIITMQMLNSQRGRWRDICIIMYTCYSSDTPAPEVWSLFFVGFRPLTGFDVSSLWMSKGKIREREAGTLRANPGALCASVRRFCKPGRLVHLMNPIFVKQTWL